MKITFECSKELRDKLQAAANQNSRTLSGQLRYFLEQSLEAQIEEPV